MLALLSGEAGNQALQRFRSHSYSSDGWIKYGRQVSTDAVEAIDGCLM